MNSRTKTGLEILEVAAVAGVLGDVLLRATPWGLNVFLFNLAFVAGAAFLMLRRKVEMLDWRTTSLLIAQLFFAAMYVFRDSVELRVADTFAIVAILSVLFAQTLKVPANVAGVFHYVIGFFGSSLNAFISPFILLGSDISWKAMPRSGFTRHLLSALRGVAIATPFILIFGALFVAADAVYQGMVERVFNIAPETFFSHAALIAVFAWLSAGYLRGLLLTGTVDEPEPVITPQTNAAETKAEASDPFLPNYRTILEHINTSDPPDAGDTEVRVAEVRTTVRASQNPDNDKGERSSSTSKLWSWANIDNSLLPAGFSLGAVEIGVVFGLIDLLFLSFVIVQIPYLFGGMDLVQSTPDFKLAEYARRGFGELVTVSALVLPLLLAAHWLIRKDDGVAKWLFRSLAGIQIALLLVIMASAVQRIVILTGESGYGLTTVRFYPLVFMSWLAIVFVWFALTVLRGARQHFAWGALWAAFIVLGATHFLNPDKFIVQTNVALMKQGRVFDSYYNAHLSDDAVPALIEAFPDLKPEHQQAVIKSLANRYCEKTKEERDLRSWSLPSSEAAKSLEILKPAVNTLGGCHDGRLANWSLDFVEYD